MAKAHKPRNPMVRLLPQRDLNRIMIQAGLRDSLKPDQYVPLSEIAKLLSEVYEPKELERLGRELIKYMPNY